MKRFPFFILFVAMLIFHACSDSPSPLTAPGLTNNPSKDVIVTNVHPLFSFFNAKGGSGKRFYTIQIDTSPRFDGPNIITYEDVPEQNQYIAGKLDITDRLHDMEDGLVRIGSGKSRGLGSVTAAIEEVNVSYPGLLNSKPDNEVWGLGKFQSNTERSDYGTWADDYLTLTGVPVAEQHGIRLRTVFSGASLACLREQATGAFVARIQNWPAREVA